MIKREDKKQLILEAASNLFSTQGFFNTVMKEVAEKAGVAVGTIYIYYQNKEELLDGIFSHASSLLLERLKKKLAKLSHPVDKMRCFLEESIEFSFRHPYYFLIIFVDFRRKAIEFPRSVVYSFFHEYLHLGGSILTEGKEQGCFTFTSAIDPIYGITGFWGAVVLRELLSPLAKKSSVRKKVALIYEMIDQTILKGLQSGAGRQEEK